MQTMLLILRAVLLSLSFFGLCATARRELKLNRFIAPCFVACSIICVLMFAGMLHVLKYGFALLYFGGFAGLIYTYFIRRTKPDWLLMGVFTAFTLFLICRFHASQLYIPDDFSHWGTAARYLLRNDAFPDGNTTYVTFQSYPLGATSFIYYVARTLDNSEPIWLIAQNLLQAILFLPILANIQGNRKIVYPVLAALFLVMYKFNRPLTSLTVDWLLSFFGFGISAAILYYRDQPRKAFCTALPGLIAVIYIKNSGMFFAVVFAVLLAWVAGRKHGKSAAIKALVLTCIVTIAAYAVWSLHVKLSYPAGFESKHAISLSAYLEKLQSKGIRRSLSIALNMVNKWLHPEFYQVFCALFMILSFVSVHLTARHHDELQAWRRHIFHYLAFCIGCYGVWFIMMYAMYIFSMPYAEARYLASFSRYDSTGLLCMVGLALIALVEFYSKVEFHSVKTARFVCVGAIAMLLGTAPLLSMGSEYPLYYSFYKDLFTNRIESNEFRDLYAAIREKYTLPGGEYFVYYGEVDPSLHLAPKYYAAKFELDSPNVKLAVNAESDLSWALCSIQGTLRADSAGELLDKQLDSCDAIILMEENAELEAALSEQLTHSKIDIPIIRAYQ